jgi:DNA repair/transcription protein MET18/MMS19
MSPAGMMVRLFMISEDDLLILEVHAFVPYLSARLQDASPGIYYISEALSIMSKWKRFPAGDAQEVLRAVFTLGASNNFASQTATTRLSLYTLVENLRSTHTNAIKRDMSEKEVVKGIVTMAELEKNPSCLRALFNVYVLLSQEWMLDDDDYKLIFDSFIRYFPVTMKEAPKDPKIPSTSELRDLLLKCFVANDGFAKMTFDAMVERLDVDSANTKVSLT